MASFDMDYLSTSPLDGNSKALTMTFRLQVWHVTMEGRCEEQNTAFSNALSDTLIRNSVDEEWVVRPTNVVIPTGGNPRDTYVPVEVDIQHQSVSFWEIDRKFSKVQQLFQKLIPNAVNEYFESINSAPRNMSLFPYGCEDVDFKKRYTQSCILYPLKLKVDRFTVPAVALEEETALKSILSNVGDGLGAFQTSIKTYMLREDLLRGSDADATNVSVTGFTKVLEELDLRYGLKAEFKETEPATQGDLTANQLDEMVCLASKSLGDAQTATSRVKPCLERLAAGSPISNQEVYQTILDLHTATVDISNYKKLILSIGGHALQKFQRVERSHGRSRSSSGALGIVLLGVALAWWNPVGLPGLASLTEGMDLVRAGFSAGAGAIALIKATRDHAKSTEAHQKARHAKDAKSKTMELERALDKAKASLLAVFCSQVQQQPLECMTTNERLVVCHEFGIDPALIEGGDYEGVLIRHKIKQLVEFDEQMGKAYDQMQKDLGFQTHTSVSELEPEQT